MINQNDFEDKAARLMNRLTVATNYNKPIKSKVDVSKIPLQQLLKIKEEMDFSDIQSKKKVRGLGDTLRKLQTSLVQDSQSRQRANETFNHTLAKIEKNMKTVLSNVHKGFAERQKKLQQKIDSLIKAQSKEVDISIKDNEELIQDMQNLQSKITAIVDQVNSLRKARLQLQARIKKQFTEQIKQLKIIFQADIRAREQREVRAVQTLKNVYKNSMQKIYIEQKEREQSEKMLMSVVEQLVDHIIQM